MKITIALLSCSFLILTACTGPNSNPNDTGGGNDSPGERRAAAGTGTSGQEDLFGIKPSNRRGAPRVEEFDGTREQFNEQQLERFMRTRCLTLGRALVQLSSDDAALLELAHQDVQDLLDRDNATINAAALQAEADKLAGKPAKSASGLIIPRYIAAELRKPRAEWDRRWLGIQGQLLQAAYSLETLDLNGWKVSIGQMMQLGSEGREFLAAQMVVRLRLANAEFRDYAKDVLVNFVPEEAIAPLIAATHVDIHDQPGIFPRQTASVLALIGAKAVPQILEIFKDANGKHIPGGDDNWKVRRFLIDALGSIGDSSAVNTLIAELDSCKFVDDKGGDRRFLYGSVIVQALGNIRDKHAVSAIVREWRRYQDPSDFVQPASRAIFLITGKIYTTPSEVPNDIK